jgi:hypothetical protein
MRGNRLFAPDAGLAKLASVDKEQGEESFSSLRRLSDSAQGFLKVKQLWTFTAKHADIAKFL